VAFWADSNVNVAERVAEAIVQGGRVVWHEDEALQEIGPKGTEKDFCRAMGKGDVLRSTSPKTKFDSSFSQVRNAYFAGEGIGKDFVIANCPSARLHGHTVSRVLASHFGEAKEAAKEEEAKAKDEEAEAKEQEASETVDEAEAERLRQEAAEAKAEAKKLRAEAKRIAGDVIDPKILMSLETLYQMECFASAIHQLKIPKGSHQEALEYVLEEEITGRKMADKLDRWWYIASGQEIKDRDRIAKEKKLKAFLDHVKDGDFKSYLLSLRETARKLADDMRIAAPTAPYYEDQKYRDAACKDLKGLIEAASELFNGLSGEPIHTETHPEQANGHPKQLTYS
jgi:hypothetical protein